LLLLMVVLLGAFGIASLNYFNAATAQVRDRWLPSTAALSDLTNTTSDFRAAEAASLLAAGPQLLRAAETQMANLDASIAQAQDRYGRIAQDPAAAALYSRFVADWNIYRGIVRRVRDLSGGGEQAAAVALYNTRSRSAYAAASDTLDALTAGSIASARAASEREEAAYRQARWLIAATIAVTALGVAGALAHVRRSISAPLLALADCMQHLAANDTGVEIGGTQGDDEIAEMARAVIVFRNNAVELLNSRFALERQASMLREKLAEEQRLMLLQRNFVTMASHEFRTPITIIDAHAQRLIAMKERLEEAELVERVAKIRGAVRRMTHLIKNLLDASRLIDGNLQLYFHPLPTDIAALLRDICAVQHEISPQAQILEHYPHAGAVWTVGDSNLLFQVFGNLLSNAIKYSPDGGCIDVRLAEADGQILVSVRDRGIGIPRGDLQRLFERYFRGSNAAGIVGTGVGLYFARTVVELHGGEIRVESQEGEGSCFTVRLPADSGAKAAVTPGLTGEAA
jgi:two-component system, OmpR family, sensor kinase